MDKCELCGQQLYIGPSEDKTELNSLAVYRVLNMVCVNPECKNYGGKDLTNPLKIASVKKIPTNSYAIEEMKVE